MVWMYWIGRDTPILLQWNHSSIAELVAGAAVHCCKKIVCQFNAAHFVNILITDIVGLGRLNTILASQPAFAIAGNLNPFSQGLLPYLEQFFWQRQYRRNNFRNNKLWDCR